MNQNRGAVGDIYYSITGSNFFYFKSSVQGILEVNNTEKEDKIVLSLKNLSNFQKRLDIPLINCEINLILTWSKNCLISSKATGNADPGDPAVVEINNPTNATFKTTNTKLYVLVVTL